MSGASIAYRSNSKKPTIPVTTTISKHSSTTLPIPAVTAILRQTVLLAGADATRVLVELRTIGDAVAQTTAEGAALGAVQVKEVVVGVVQGLEHRGHALRGLLRCKCACAKE